MDFLPNFNININLKIDVMFFIYCLQCQEDHRHGEGMTVRNKWAVAVSARGRNKVSLIIDTSWKYPKTPMHKIAAGLKVSPGTIRMVMNWRREPLKMLQNDKALLRWVHECVMALMVQEVLTYPPNH